MNSFEQIFEKLQSLPKKRLIAAWGVDDHTINAVHRAINLGFIEGTLVGNKTMILEVCKAENLDYNVFNIVNVEKELDAVAKAVEMVRNGEGDILMKGQCSTDKYMRAILNKEKGLLPPKAVLSHISVLSHPGYHKFLLISDMAVIPAPDLSQKVAITRYLVKTAQSLGIAKPKVAFLAATEQMLAGMPACVEAAMLAKMADRGQISGCIADGPLALDVCLNKEAAAIKKLNSPVAGDVDCILFPNIESANVMYKCTTQLTPEAKQAAIVCGAMAPCVLSSRADSIETKLNSIALAAMTAQ